MILATSLAGKWLTPLKSVNIYLSTVSYRMTQKQSQLSRVAFKVMVKAAQHIIMQSIFIQLHNFLSSIHCQLPTKTKWHLVERIPQPHHTVTYLRLENESKSSGLILKLCSISNLYVLLTNWYTYNIHNIQHVFRSCPKFSQLISGP